MKRRNGREKCEKERENENMSEERERENGQRERGRRFSEYGFLLMKLIAIREVKQRDLDENIKHVDRRIKENTNKRGEGNERKTVKRTETR